MFTKVLNKVIVGAATTGVVIVGMVAPVAAHTEASYVAVPATKETTISFQPTHGCDGSPTVEVSVQVPVPGATGAEVDGWTVEITDDDNATTITWTGGVLADDAHGDFPVAFTAPDTVGELVLLPAVQVCENGEELAWIDGDPESSYPAPRLLILSADSEPATSIDDVPADAPGRDLLTTIVDTDNPDPSVDEDPTDPEVATPTSAVDPEEENLPTPISAVEEGDETDDDSSVLPIVLGVVAVGVLIGVGVVVMRKRDGSGPSGDGI